MKFSKLFSILTCILPITVGVPTHIDGDDLHFDRLSQEDDGVSDVQPGAQDRISRSSVKPYACKGPGRVAVPEECTQYYTCSRAGEYAAIAKCPTGKSFHHQQRTCVRMTPKECRQHMCKSPDQRFPEPYSQDGYLSCENMHPEPKKCPEGQNFNPSSSKCEGETVRGDVGDDDIRGDEIGSSNPAEDQSVPNL